MAECSIPSPDFTSVSTNQGPHTDHRLGLGCEARAFMTTVHLAHTLNSPRVTAFAARPRSRMPSLTSPTTRVQMPTTASWRRDRPRAASAGTNSSPISRAELSVIQRSRNLHEREQIIKKTLTHRRWSHILHIHIITVALHATSSGLGCAQPCQACQPPRHVSRTHARFRIKRPCRCSPPALLPITGPAPSTTTRQPKSPAKKSSLFASTKQVS